MNFKTGYKKTEIGVIPEDWDVKELNSVVNITRLAGYEYSTVWEESENGEIIALRGFNIGKNKIIEREFVRISNKLSMKLIRSRLFKGDVVYPCVGTIGNAVVIEEDDKYHIQQNIAKITPLKIALNSHFLAYYLMSNFGLKEIEKFNGSSSQPNILVGSLRKYSIILPPLPEQTAIAAALSDVDALMGELDKLIAKKRDIKQATMQQLLTGKKRLAGFSGEWEVKRLGDVATLINGRAYKISEWETTGTPVIRLQNLTGSDNYYFSKLNLPTYQYCHFGDLLYMWSATFGIHIWQGEKAIYHYHIWKIEPTKGLADKNFLFHKLNEITESLKQKSTNGGTMLHITKSFMENNKIMFPPIEEQTAIATILSDMDAEINALQQKRDKTAQLKQGMMQELLTGRIRLSIKE